jgi:hypothetical protein
MPPPVATTTAATMMITDRLVKRSRNFDNTRSSLCSHPCLGERGSFKAPGRLSTP